MKTLPIEQYLPQKAPFILVDNIIDGSEKHCTTTLSIREENPLVCQETEKPFLLEGGLLENIAQTCASHIGYVEIHIRKNPKIRIGVVALYKGISIHKLPQVGDTLITHVEETENFGELSIYNASTTCNGTKIAEGEIRVVLTDKIA